MDNPIDAPGVRPNGALPVPPDTRPARQDRPRPAARRRAGRPTALTDETECRILDALRAGLTYRLAAAAAGVSERTFHNWKARGESATSGRYLQFVHALRAAEGEAALHCLLL